MKENKWINGALPAILIHGSIGSVYAWSTLVGSISEEIGKNTSLVQFAFSLAIFFLGMSAAFGGKLVEKNVKQSSIISTFFFTIGLLLTSVGIINKFLPLIYISYGCLMGIGLGIGYLTPVKTLMLWFKDNKGLATGIAVCAFGFASSIASWLNNFLINHMALEKVFFCLAIIYMIPMIIASFLLKKPSWWHEQDIKNDNFKVMTMWKDKKFRRIWIIMFINIASGLALISITKPLMEEININSNHPISPILVVSVMGIFNGLGRIIISTVSDRLKKRIQIYSFILIWESIAMVLMIDKTTSILAFISLCIVSAGYGAGFSCLPSLLSDIYGMKNISKIHGLSLTSWAIAGLIGNQISNLVYEYHGNYVHVPIILFLAYSIAEVISYNIKYVNYVNADQEK